MSHSEKADTKNGSLKKDNMKRRKKNQKERNWVTQSQQAEFLAYQSSPEWL